MYVKSSSLKEIEWLILKVIAVSFFVPNKYSRIYIGVANFLVLFCFVLAHVVVEFGVKSLV